VFFDSNHLIQGGTECTGLFNLSTEFTFK